MRQLHLIAHGEPSDVIELKTVPEPALGQDDVLILMEAAPLNPSDFMLVRGGIEGHPCRPNDVSPLCNVRVPLKTDSRSRRG